MIAECNIMEVSGAIDETDTSSISSIVIIKYAIPYIIIYNVCIHSYIRTYTYNIHNIYWYLYAESRHGEEIIM